MDANTYQCWDMLVKCVPDVEMLHRGTPYVSPPWLMIIVRNNLRLHYKDDTFIHEKDTVLLA